MGAELAEYAELATLFGGVTRHLMVACVGGGVKWCQAGPYCSYLEKYTTFYVIYALVEVV